MRRAFSLTEILLVVVVIGVAGSLAASNISTAVRAAEARSERLAAVRAVKAEKMRSGEQLQPLALRASGDQLSFFRADITRNSKGKPTGCTLGAPIDVQRYPALRLGMVGGTTLCLDDDGRPVNPAVAVAIDIDEDGDGSYAAAERATVAVSVAGLVELGGAIDKKKKKPKGGDGPEEDTLSKKLAKDARDKGKNP